ncbi:MAG: LAGLIDADG family homing endonuclease [Candidatus Micrarchaeota archaeon]
MDLGEGIRRALNRITGAAIVDEKAIKELVKELQRVLISNDVNVKLVYELTKKIEEKALTEKKAERLNLREHIVKIVYDELVAILGEKYEPQLKKQKILILGLFGSGKCVSGSSRIPLHDGRVFSAKELYEQTQAIEEKVDGGYIKSLQTPLDVPCLDLKTMKMTAGKATYLWKLKKTDPLYSIYLDNGNQHTISSTPEHPFFSLKNGQMIQARADSLHVGDFIAVPSNLSSSGIPFDLKHAFMQYAPSELSIVDFDLASQIKQELKRKKTTLQMLHQEAKSSSNYASITHLLKKGFVPLWLLRAVFPKYILSDEIHVKASGAHDIIKFPLLPSDDLAEFLGYFIADGHMDDQSLEVVNEEPAIISRSKLLFESLFGIGAKSLQSKRSKALFRVYISSITATSLFHALFGFPLGRKSDSVRIPALILQGSQPQKARFLRAYFDCDGYVDSNKRSVEFATASEGLSGDLRLLLLQFGFFPSLSIKRVNGVPYYRVFLRSRNVEDFASQIFSLVPKKQKRLLEASAIGEGQGLGFYEHIPTGSLLKTVREKYGLSIGELQNRGVSSYGLSESKKAISKNSLRKFLSCVFAPKKSWLPLLEQVRGEETYSALEEKIGNRGWLNATLSRLYRLGFVAFSVNSPLKVSLTPTGHEKLQQATRTTREAEHQLRLLADSDVNWLRISRISQTDQEEWVYDLTVEEHHNFVANEMIVHNTTSIAKLAKFYQGKGLKVCVIAGDVHRPAAVEQLQQLSEQVRCGFYGDRGKTADQIAAESLKLQQQYDILIFDSAGRSAFDGELAKELKKINDVFVPDEKYLVVSADLGQVAGKQASQFNDAVGVTGVIVTKMDGSGKGGGALSAVKASNSRVAFLTLGEKPDALEVFDAKKFVARLVGFADLESLLSKVQEISDEEAMKKVLEDGKLDYETFLAQMRSMRKMGPMKQILQMLGMYDVPEEVLGQSEQKMKSYEAAVQSMTRKERTTPELMKNKSRQERVASGAGLKPDDVRELVSNFEKISKMMKGMKGNRGLMKRFGNMLPPGLKM